MEDLKKASVEQWGYSCVDDQELQKLVWPVRFKPGLTFVLVLIGLIFKQPVILCVVGALGLLGTFLQKISWIDLFYNHAVRHWFHAPKMSEDPALRRMACGLADAFVVGAGIAVFFEKLLLAWVLGGMVLALSGSVIFTGICLPVYMIHQWTKKS